MAVSRTPVDEIAASVIAQRCAALMDDGDHSGLAELFTADAELVVPRDPKQSAPQDSVHGRVAIADFYRSALTMPTQHAVVGCVVDPDPDGAGLRVRVACRAHHLMPDGLVVVFVLRYLDYVVVDGEAWRIARREVCIDWIERHPVAAAPVLR